MFYKLYDFLWNYEDPDRYAPHADVVRSTKRGVVIITGTFIIAMLTIAILHIVLN